MTELLCKAISHEIKHSLAKNPNNKPGFKHVISAHTAKNHLISQLVLKTGRHCSTGDVQHQSLVTDNFPITRYPHLPLHINAHPSDRNTSALWC